MKIVFDKVIILQKLAEALSENKTLKVLNVESNFISGEAIVEIMKAINKNQTLQELRVANQVRDTSINNQSS